MPGFFSRKLKFPFRSRSRKAGTKSEQESATTTVPSSQASQASSASPSSARNSTKSPPPVQIETDDRVLKDVRRANDANVEDAGLTDPDQLRVLAERRSQLWKAAFDALALEKPKLVANFHAIVHDYARLDANIDIFSPDGISAVTESQKTQMETKQWKYHWLGETYKVRDTAQGILKMVDLVQPGIAYGMQFAPPFVSMPWSVISMLIPYMMKDLEQMNTAIGGLKDVTAILASYRLAEEEFLAHPATHLEFYSIAKDLYAKILEYQALAAQYFGKSTLKRLELDAVAGTSWEDALAVVKRIDRLCRQPLDALAVRLQQHSFKTLTVLLTEQSNTLDGMIATSVESTKWRMKRDITDWISTANPFQDHADVRGRLGEEYFGTGQWLFHDTDYTSWRQSSSGILLLQGVVGTGKSCITSIAIESLIDSPEGCVAFFYCANESNDEGGANSTLTSVASTGRSTAHIFRSILAQCAVLPDGSIAKTVKDAFKLSRNQGPGESNLESSSVLNMLKDVLNTRSGQITLVFDALDELHDRASFFETIEALCNFSNRIRILFSSRPSVDIVTELLLPDRKTKIIPVQSLNSYDIGFFVDREIDTRLPIAGRSLTPGQTKVLQGLADRLREALKARSQGVFRWVDLELDIFFPKSPRQGRLLLDLPRRVRELEESRAPAVERLILAYDQIYADAMGHPDEIDRRVLVKVTMKMVLCSFRPLTTTELTALVKLRLFAHARERASDDIEGVALVSSKDILQACSNFISEMSRGESKIVKLAHLSVRQYFEDAFPDTSTRGREHFYGNDKDEFSVPQQHLEAAISCIGLADVASDDLVPEFADSRDALLSYSNKFWAIHSRNAANSPSLEAAIVCQSSSDDFSGLQKLVASKARLEEANTMGDTPLHIAVLSGDGRQVQLLLNTDSLFKRKSSLIGLKNREGQQPLHLAASRGSDASFRILLLAGADIKALDNLGLSPLHLAVLHGENGIIKAAVESTVTLDARDKTGGTALHLAAFGNPGAYRLLLKGGASLTAQTDDGLTPSQVAVYGEYWQRKMLQQESTTPVAVALEASEPQSHPVSTGLVGMNRPRIVIESNLGCRYCDVETWLEKSRRGDTHAHSPSIDQLGKSAKNGCSLCKEIHQAVLVLDKKFGILDAVSAEIHVKATLAIDSPPNSNQRDALLVFVGNTLCAELEFCISKADAGKPGVSPPIFVGRLVEAGDEALHIRSWSDRCSSNHPDCQAPKHRDTVLPPLLIDAGRDSASPPRLVLSKDADRGRGFIFCSFTTGKTTRGWKGWTNRVNLDQRLREIPWAEIPTTIQDAISLVQRLEIHPKPYVFVDGICSPTDDMDAMKQYVDMVPQYISSADYVFACINGDGMHNHCLPSPEPSMLALSLDARLSTGGATFKLHIRQHLSTADEVMSRQFFSRSWRAQEAILSQKMIILSTDQVFWNCGRSLHSQAHATEDAPMLQTLPTTISIVSKWPKLASRDLKKAYLVDQWQEYVELIGSGALLFREDRLLTVAGVAAVIDKEMLNLGISDRQHLSTPQGIRMDDFARGLLWTTQPQVTNTADSTPPKTSPVNELASTWSWGHLGGYISYDVASMASRDSEFGLLEISDSIKTSAANPDITVSDPLPDITGYTQTWEAPGPAGYTYLFDQLDDEKNWVAGQTPLVFLMVSRLAYTAAGNNYRWVGLMLRPRSDANTDGNVHVRVGVFLGPDCGGSSDLGSVGWKKQVITPA